MKSLERAYKEVVDNNNATGRKRKDFEFESQMQEFMAKKRNVNPLILLSETNTESEQVIQVSKSLKSRISGNANDIYVFLRIFFFLD